MWLTRKRLGSDPSRLGNGGTTPVRSVLTVEGATLTLSEVGIMLTREGEVVEEVAWTALASLAWSDATDALALTWIDPAAEPLQVALAVAPTLDFLTYARECLSRTQVFHATRTLTNGTVVVVWVLRDAGGLFTVTTATGAIPEGERDEVAHLEARASDAVGLAPARSDAGACVSRHDEGSRLGRSRSGC